MNDKVMIKLKEPEIIQNGVWVYEPCIDKMIVSIEEKNPIVLV